MAFGLTEPEKVEPTKPDAEVLTKAEKVGLLKPKRVVLTKPKKVLTKKAIGFYTLAVGLKKPEEFGVLKPLTCGHT
jgi:hypothetical protein